MNWYNFGAVVLMLAVLAGVVGANEIAMYLSLASVGCAMLDIVVG